MVSKLNNELRFCSDTIFQSDVNLPQAPTSIMLCNFCKLPSLSGDGVFRERSLNDDMRILHFLI